MFVLISHLVQLAPAFAATSTIAYEGYITDAATSSPITTAGLGFRFDVYGSPASGGACLLYSEDQTANVTDGHFAVHVGSVATATQYGGRTSFSQVFNAASAMTGASSCAFDPTSSGASWFLRVSVYSSGSYLAISDVKLSPAARATQAAAVDGFAAGNILRVADASGAPQSASALTPANFTELLALLNGTSTHYLVSTSNGAALPRLTSNSPTVEGDLWFDSSSHQVKYYDGTSTQIVGAAGTAVTSVTTGTGLISSGAAMSPTIALATINSTGGTGATKINYDVYGRVTGSGPLAESDIPSLSTAGKVSGNAITSGTIGGSTSISTMGNVGSSTSSTRTLSIYPASPSSSIIGVNITASTSQTSPYVLTLPISAGTVNQILTTDGSGQLSWTNPASGGVASVVGNAPISISGTVAAPVVNVSDATTTAKGVVQLAPDASTTTGSVVQANDSRLSNSRAPSGTAGGDLAGSYPSPTIAANAVTTAKMFANPGANRLVATDPTSGTTLVPLACLPGQLLQWSAGMGWGCVNASALSVGSAGGLSGSLAGDVSGTTSTTSVDKIKGTDLVISSLAGGNFLKYNGTSWVNSNIATTDIASGTLAAARLPAFTGDVTSTVGTAALTLGTVPINKGGTGLTTIGAANQVLGVNAGATGVEYKTITAGSGVAINNSAGALTISAMGSGGTVTNVTGTPPIAVATGSSTPVISIAKATTSVDGYLAATDFASFFKNGGNSFGAAATIGTNDNNSFSIKTNSTTRMTLDANGNMGIGTATPGVPLDVYSASASLVAQVAGNASNGSTLKVTGSGASSVSLSAANNGANSTAMSIYESGTSGIGLDVSSSDANGVGAKIVGGKYALILNGKVGMGTATPQTNLDLFGGPGTTLKIVDGLQGTGKVLTSDGSGVASWATPAGASQWTTNGSYVYYNGGNVGIGSSNPSYPLSVVGAVQSTSGGFVFPDLSVQTTAVATTMNVTGATPSVVYKPTLNYTASGTNGGTAATLNPVVAMSGSGGPGRATAVNGVAMNSGTSVSEIDGGIFEAIAQNGSSATSIAGVVGSVTAQGSGMLATAAYGGRFSVAGSSSNFALMYGVHINVLSGTNAYSLYSAGSAPSYLNGNVGIGISNPTQALQVAGIIAPSADVTYSLGTSALRFTSIYAQTGTINTSDVRQKREIQDSDLGLRFITKLRPVSYRWKTGSDTDQHYGLIAQETEKVIAIEKDASDPQSGKKFGIVAYDAETDRYGIRYTELVSPLIKAVQEIVSLISGMTDKVTKLESENSALKDGAEKTRLELQRKTQEFEALKNRVDRLEQLLQTK